MSRHHGWVVRISPDVRDVVRASGSGRGDSPRLARDFEHAMDRLARNGTRAAGAKKLRSFDLWEIRVGEHRAYFCLAGGARSIAVGALVVKKSKRLRAKKLGSIEQRVHRWRDTLEETT